MKFKEIVKTILNEENIKIPFDTSKIEPNYKEFPVIKNWKMKKDNTLYGKDQFGRKWLNYKNKKFAFNRTSKSSPIWGSSIKEIWKKELIQRAYEIGIIKFPEMDKYEKMNW